MSDAAALQRELENLGRRIAHGLAKQVRPAAGPGHNVRGISLHGQEIEELARLSLFFAELEARLARALERLEVPESHGERRT
jgi:hypothetical protein